MSERRAPLGDVPSPEARRLLQRAAAMAASYLERVGDRPVLSRVRPGDVHELVASQPPRSGEELDQIFADIEGVIEPGLTHWNHPAFFGYFAISGSVPGIAAETLCAAYNVNAMLWRTSPAATELEERVCDWLRQMIGLPNGFRGHINDTASIGTLVALGAARHRALPEARVRGLHGLAAGVVYTSEQAHSSVDKAALTLGLGLEGVRRLPTDDRYRLVPAAVGEAIRADRAAGRVPVAIVATAGTTSTTSVDPLRALAEIADAESVWLHVDAAYGGAAAICSEYRQRFDGWQDADSVVVNPHKWLFTPIDCSVLFTRSYAPLEEAFAHRPAYLRSDEDQETTQLMNLGVQLGRRFRALKLWMVIRAFGVEGLEARIRQHCEWASGLAERVAAEAGFELCAPTPFSVVCFRALAEDGDHDALNAAVMRRVNDSGRAFLSSTELDGRLVLRLAIGNLRTEERHVDQAWEQIVQETGRLRAELSAG